jgi:hypothetical protein
MVTTTYDEIGSLDDPPGSPRWAIAVRVEIQHFLDQSESDAKHLENWLQAMQQHDGWKNLSNRSKRPFQSFEDFCVCKRPFGLGYSKDSIDRIVSERKSAQERAKGAKPLLNQTETGRGKTLDVVNSSSGGNSADYLTARIARDHPKILERMKQGEFTSVRAAAKEAGIVKDPTPLQLLRRAWNKASKKELQWGRGCLAAERRR